MNITSNDGIIGEFIPNPNLLFVALDSDPLKKDLTSVVVMKKVNGNTYVTNHLIGKEAEDLWSKLNLYNESYDWSAHGTNKVGQNNE